MVFVCVILFSKRISVHRLCRKSLGSYGAFCHCAHGRMERTFCSSENILEYDLLFWKQICKKLKSTNSVSSVTIFIVCDLYADEFLISRFLFGVCVYCVQFKLNRFNEFVTQTHKLETYFCFRCEYEWKLFKYEFHENLHSWKDSTSRCEIV